MPPRAFIPSKPTPPSLVLLATPEQVAAAQARLRVDGSKLHLVTDRFEPAVDALPNLARLPTLAPELRVPILDALTAAGVDVPAEVWSYLGVSYAERHPVAPILRTSATDAPVTILDLARSPEERAVLAELRPTYQGVSTLNAAVRAHGVRLTIEAIQEILGNLGRRGLCVVEPTQRAQWCLTSNSDVDAAVFARAKNLQNFMRESVSATDRFAHEEAELVRRIVARENFEALLTWDERVAIHKLYDRVFTNPPEGAAAPAPVILSDPVNDYIERGVGNIHALVREAPNLTLLTLVTTLPIALHDLRGAGRVQDARKARMQETSALVLATLADLLDQVPRPY